MKPTTILAAAVWLFVVGGSILNTLMMSPSVFMDAPQFPWPIVFMPLIIIVGAFAKRKNPGNRLIEEWVDRHLSQGTYGEFVSVLKLELMFAAMCFGVCLAALARAYVFGSPAFPPVLVGFFASGGVAFVAAYFIRRWRGGGVQTPK